MKPCSNCKERAIIGFYVGKGKFAFACPNHVDEVQNQYPLGVPFILDINAEEVVDKVQKKEEEDEL